MSTIIEVLRDFSARPFSYENNSDCCAFVGAVVEVFHGHNPMSKFEYKDEKGAAEIMKKHGTLLGAVVAALGRPSPIADAQDGDVLIALQTNDEWILGVVVGERMAVKTKTGLMDWPIEFATYRWRP